MAHGERSERRRVMLFIGVSTQHSSIRRVFPRWSEALGIDARLEGIDLPLRPPRAAVRRVIGEIGANPAVAGALVTTHKVDVYQSCRDLFDEIDRQTDILGEIGCISKRRGRLVGCSVDHVTSGLALDTAVSSDWWRARERDAFIMGAGGAGLGLSVFLLRRSLEEGRPRRLIVSERDPSRLNRMRAIHERLAPAGGGLPRDYLPVGGARDNDAALHSLSEGSLVVNATGLGKDAPGSPCSDGALFPHGALVWDFNYRGSLAFLRQASLQRQGRNLHAIDGWDYFLHGWLTVIGLVFGVAIPSSGERFERLSALAASERHDVDRRAFDPVG